jgi:hypothetical protein
MIYAKAQQEDLSPEQKQVLKKLAAALRRGNGT